MRTVFKYPLNPKSSITTVTVPKGAKFLSAAEQHGNISVWAEVETDNTSEERMLYIVGTGCQLPDSELSFIGTVLTQNGLLVHHVYELLPCACACKSA